MSKRITVMIDDSIDRKLRTIQAKQIQQSNGSVSYSKVLNETLQKVL
ncbi:MAG: hypothetical protein K5785_00865 [Nitrosarchaeum sp.]|nr:hypothetical protein [Nitrosarchaeum sp.]